MKEGLSRLATVIRWAGYLVLGMTGAGLIYYFAAEESRHFGEAALILIVGAVFAVPLLAIAWVIEGFAKKSTV